MKIEHLEANLIKYEAGSAVTTRDMQELAAALDKRLTNRETFGLLMARSGEPAKNPEASRWWNEWLKQNKQLLKTYCAGVAMVTDSDRLFKLYKLLAGTMISRMFGCAGSMFASEPEAVVWLRERLAESGQ